MSRKVRVKICGITRLEDALAAIDAGADALGFVFYEPSPRAINLNDAIQIINHLPPFVTSTALFVDPAPGLVVQVINQTKIDLLQFHGQETALFCERFQRPYIKAIAMQPSTNLDELSQEYRQSKALLLDTYKPGVPGGTGEQFNWNWVPKKLGKPLILAGGLTAENVADAIRQTEVYAVDVSGGVEQSKGIKSQTKIKMFIDACQS